MRNLFLLGALALASSSFGQYATLNTSLHSRLSNATLGGGNGNDCWGYVSPSGREYALMGQVDQTAVVEITNPNSPVILDTFPHSTTTWSDIKVYRDHAYVVTEAAGSGIQVLDLSQIDAGIVTLVRTIASPGSSHNIHIDETSGFLYTCGSRSGTGTTMCFDLTNPSNPVQVGLGSLTTDYMHDVQVLTYTTGPFAGKQILFGFSEGRGVDIYDVTNKFATSRIARATYPNIGYCHQGWVSSDRKYLYVDDELDESNQTINTRSLIFNVEDVYNPFFVSTFSSGLQAIDHNQYWDDGFIFQANYRSGLRIFDAKNPTQPTEVGYFDTYPTSNSANFSGAWSTYPFFPSGRVIISDINRGLFVVDATQALTRIEVPTDFQLQSGQFGAGAVAALAAADDNKVSFSLAKATGPGSASYPIVLDVKLRTYDDQPQAMNLKIESASSVASTQQQVSVLNVTNGQFESIDNRMISTSDSSASLSLSGNVSRFVNPATKEVLVRLRWNPSVRNRVIPQIQVDQVSASVLR